MTLSTLKLLRPVLAAACLIAGAAGATTADAAYLPGAAIDGPSPDIQSLQGLDVSLDGTGGLVYLKAVGGVAHVFASRLANGVWQPPEQLDAGLPASATQAVIAAGNGGRLAVAFVSSGELFAEVRPAGATSWMPPVPLGSGASDPAISMTAKGGCYLTWTAPGGSTANVYAAEMPRNANGFTVVPSVLDVDPAEVAGTGTLRSQVTTAPDGTGIATWGEVGADGRTHVWIRRILGSTLSLYPQDATEATEPGSGAAGGNADDPAIGVRDDSSFAWIVFRQQFADGSHIVQRPLIGSLFDPGTVIAGAENTTTPQIAVNSAGDAIATSAGSDDDAAFGVALHDGTWGRLYRLDTPPAGVLPAPIPTFPDSSYPTVSWIQDPVPGDSSATVHSRQWKIVATKRTVPAPDVDTTVSNAALGPVAPSLGFAASGDRIGDVVIGFVQGGSLTGRSIVVASYDRPPGTFVLNTNQQFKKSAEPPLSWSAALDLWGPVTYNVMLDGVSIGQTKTTKFTPTLPIPDGVHRWRIFATDIHGQTTGSETSRMLPIDTTPPQGTISIAGTKKIRRTLTLTVRAHDLPQGTTLPGTTPTTTTPAPTPTAPAPTTPAPTTKRTHAKAPTHVVVPPVASGVKSVTLQFGDATPPVTGTATLLQTKHVYRTKGTYTLLATITDKAGNSAMITRSIHIAK